MNNKQQIFVLKDDYIELIKLLKITEIAQSGGHAKMLVDNLEVHLNGAVETRKRAKIRKGDCVQTGNHTINIQ
jgi:ribosome-associated protein